MEIRQTNGGPIAFGGEGQNDAENEGLYIGEAMQFIIDNKLDKLTQWNKYLKPKHTIQNLLLFDDDDFANMGLDKWDVKLVRNALNIYQKHNNISNNNDNNVGSNITTAKSDSNVKFVFITEKETRNHKILKDSIQNIGGNIKALNQELLNVNDNIENELQRVDAFFIELEAEMRFKKKELETQINSMKSENENILRNNINDLTETQKRLVKCENEYKNMLHSNVDNQDRQDYLNKCINDCKLDTSIGINIYKAEFKKNENNKNKFIDIIKNIGEVRTSGNCFRLSSIEIQVCVHVFNV